MRKILFISFSENMYDDAFLHRIAITMIEGVGDVLARQLISYCGGVDAVFKERKKALVKIPGIGPKTAAAIANFKDFKKAEKELEFIHKHKIRVFFYTDADYPARMKNCHDAPLILYFKGSESLDARRMIAVVGTREATDYGKDQTKNICLELGRAGATIVSGLAYGIDITAHRTCIEHGIPTIGVVAHGLDRIYPQQHTSTARKMINLGGILTENPSGTIPDRENFPKRNRIIAGLCDAVIVTEAAKTGGALITADIANSYNRDVFAVPAKVIDLQSEGCNNLIKTHKAALIQSAQDVLYIMDWKEDTTSKKQKQIELFHDLNKDEKACLSILTNDAGVYVDEIAISLSKTQSLTAALLLNLELKGIIQCLPGKKYKKS
ncbi:MAG: DNA-processing protein DprA [Bacteroidota bacterium]